MAQKISRALLSVSNKTGIVEFARQLSNAGVTLLSTGGTAAAIAEQGIEVLEVSSVTGFPEMMDGRVKTLHPKIHGAILGRRSIDGDVMGKHDIIGIDLVVVNLYPFVETIAKPDCTLAEAIENIDIGGPAMIRSAAKNHADVAVLTDPADYSDVASSIAANGGVSDQKRYQLACKAFSHTRIFVMVKIRISLRLFIVVAPLNPVLPMQSSCRAKRFPTITLEILMRHLNALISLTNQPASLSNMPIRVVWQSLTMSPMLMKKPISLIRYQHSVESLRLTVR